MNKKQNDLDKFIEQLALKLKNIPHHKRQEMYKIIKQVIELVNKNTTMH